MDTSIFHEMFKAKQDTFQEKINEFADGRRFAAYYTAIELNRGFLQTMVAHHSKVLELQDVASAITILGNGYGRVKSNALTLETYMINFNGHVSGDYRVYAANLESIIFDMSDRANELVRHFLGHFSDHALCVLDLYSSDQYEDFLDRCRSFSDVELEDFWIDNDVQLYKIRDRILGLAPRLRKDQFELLQFIERIMAGDYTAEYEHLSDFVISLECPKNTKMIAHDHSFERLLIPLQQKFTQYVSF